ncbi:MAG: GGDEF domain-containing protein, partial [Clostridia bacterium]
GYLGMDNPPIEKSKNIVSLLMALTYFITASIQAYNDKKLLEKLSYVDSMSGLKNRNAYILDIDNYKNNKENQKVGVVYIDINRLKEINDNFGHLSGDKTIVTTAKCISKIFCEYNVYRTGGDEFVIICYDIEEKEFSTKVEELLALFEEVKISVSLGKQWLLKCADINSLIALADQQMYSAKKDTYIKNKESHR